MPQYVVVRLTNGQVPQDGTFGSGEIFVTTQVDEHTARQFVADQFNAKSGEHLYSVIISAFTDGVVSRAVT